jgi:hypothetical protein
MFNPERIEETVKTTIAVTNIKAEIRTRYLEYEVVIVATRP